ncbi:MAG: helix-turn-helix transcriptional regulator [Clostridia bacterium]
MTIGQRVKCIRSMQTPKMTQTDFGQKLNLSRAQIKTYELDTVSPSDATLKLICMTFDVNWLWLKDGEGEMKNPPDTVDEMVDRIMTGSESFKKSVFRAFARLGDDEWQALQTLYDSIKKECH